MRMNRLLRTSSLMALLALLMLSLPVAAQRLEKEVSIKGAPGFFRGSPHSPA